MFVRARAALLFRNKAWALIVYHGVETVRLSGGRVHDPA